MRVRRLRVDFFFQGPMGVPPAPLFHARVTCADRHRRALIRGQALEVLLSAHWRQPGGMISAGALDSH